MLARVRLACAFVVADFYWTVDECSCIANMQVDNSHTAATSHDKTLSMLQRLHESMR